jgi:predicted MFS family arabinose efflux permease
MLDRRLPRAAAFWSAATFLVLMLAASGAPSPLYRVYQQQFDFSSGALTTVFGIYAFSLLAALLSVGSLSDHIGRRPVLVAAFLLEALAMALFLFANGVVWLLAARAVQGLATGALTSTLGASLLDLQRHDKPLGAFINSISSGVGLGLGAAGAGLLIQFAPSPTDWTFGALAGCFLLGAAGTFLLPETSPRLPGALTSLRPRIHVPPLHRRAFAVALPILIACWAMGGFYLSLGPSLVADTFAIENHLVGGLLILAWSGTSVVGSLVFRTAPPEKALFFGALVFNVGVVGTLSSVFFSSALLLFTGAAVTGFGFGAAFLGTVTTISLGVAPGHRAGLLASIFVVGYLSFSIPAIAAGIATGEYGLLPTIKVYASTVIILALLALVGLAHVNRIGFRTHGAQLSRR